MVLQTLSGGATLALALLVGIGLLAGYASLVFWVYRDATRRGSERAGTWAVAVALFAPTMILYFLRQRAIGEATEPETYHDRLARVLVASALVGLGVGIIATPPDPFTQITFVGGGILSAIPLGYLVVFHTTLRRSETAA